MELFIILILILINGLFSMSEISVVASRKAKLDLQKKHGDRKAKKILFTKEKPEGFLSTVQIAITAIGLIIGMYSGNSLIEPIAKLLSAIGLEASSTALAKVIIIVCITLVTLILGELLPKKIGMNAPEKIARVIIEPMNFLSKLAYPFVWLLSATTNLLMKVLDIQTNKSVSATEEEIKAIINDSAEGGEIQEVEQDIVERVFSLGDRDIASLMTHRNDFDWLDASDNVAGAKEKLNQNIHYIYPVADKTLDNIVGMIYLKDFFQHTDKSQTIRDIMREPQFLYENVSAYDALETFKINKIHYALVIDEFGMVQGMVTMNDILESLVGNVSELDINNNEAEFKQREDGTYLVDGQYPFFDFLTHFDMEDKYQTYNYNTLSGLILEETGRIPKIGDVIKWENFVFEIVDMDLARIDKVLVRVEQNRLKDN
ncbi:MAG: hemolysin family protein [Bacteroidales bacterium]|jgi:putative hemolysin|nr:hemolysin family protein [Bacteroidales bacterium]